MKHTWPERPIAIVTPLYGPAAGGVERYVERLAAGLQQRGVGLEILATDPSLRRPASELRDGVRVLHFPTVHADRIYYPAPLLARWLERHSDRYSLIHAHNLHTLMPLAAAWAARAGTRPLVLTSHWHGTGHTPFRRALHLPYRPLASWVARRASAIIANSQAEAALLRSGLGSGLDITILPLGVDLPGERDHGTAGPGGAGGPGTRSDPDDATGRVTLLSVGRLERYKGLERVVEALAELPSAVRLVVVGRGPAESALLEAAAAAGVRDRVTLRGRVSDAELWAWYASAAAFVSLSAHESFGLTVLEAAAAGMPVVASDIPAYRESTRFLPTGRLRLVGATDGPRTVAAIVRTALAEGRVEDTTRWPIPTWDGLVEGTLKVYRTALGTSGQAPGW